MNKPAFYPEHNCICAYPEEPILSFYKGYFDCVYIMLSPFQKVDENENHIEYISWKEVVALTGFRYINQLDIALRNAIGGLGTQFRNDKDVEILRSTCERHQIVVPEEGSFSETLKADMLHSLLDRGHQYMFIGDDLGTERMMLSIQKIRDKEQNETIYYGNENWYTLKNEILYTTHWDSFYTMLGSDKKTVEGIIERYKFEGFYCDDDTKIYWSLYQ